MLPLRETYLAFGTPDFTEMEIAAVTRVMQSGWVGFGRETIDFERELAEYLGVPEVVCVNSCTSALFLSLLVEGVSSGHEVIVPSLTWCATANAALYLGATPVLCDVDPETMCVTPETVKAQLTPRTKAVVVVHYGGLGIDIDALKRSLPDGVAIVEDAAHAFGAKHPSGKQVGASGNLACFSFYANKNLSTGDGGAIALMDAAKANRLRRLRMSGLESNAWSRYVNPKAGLALEMPEMGYKMNFTDLQASIGRVQLRRFGELCRIRRDIALRYKARVLEAALPISFQSGAFEESHARHLLVGICDPGRTGMKRDDLFLALRERNIGASIHYRPLHAMPLYEQYQSTELPGTEVLSASLITLPIGARMELSDVDYVVSHLADIISGNARP